MRAPSHRPPGRPATSRSKVPSPEPRDWTNEARHEQPKRPTSPSGYFEALTRIVCQSGMRWRVVDAKWPGIRAAFRDFDPERAARMTDRDIDRLAKDERVIRNVPKIKATVLNAKEMVALDKARGGFRGSLRSVGNFVEAGPALRKRFRFLGDHGSYYFLWSVGEKVPDWNQWAARPKPKPGRGAGSATAAPRPMGSATLRDPLRITVYEAPARLARPRWQAGSPLCGRDDVNH